MAAAKDSLSNLERHRQLLEENVEKLRKALRHWHDWSFEYEALKEEVEALADKTSRKDLARIRRDFDGQFVDAREVKEIFGRTDLRSAEQIFSVLSRRIEYVDKNIETLEKQVEAAENKLAVATVVSNPDGRDEEGNAITDIIENLDDDDNVVSFKLQTAGEAQPQILDVLAKAGITDLEEDNPSIPEPSNTAPEPSKAAPEPAAASTPIERSVTTRKSVTFDEDTKPQDDGEISRNAQRVQTIMKTAREDEIVSRETAVIPEDESPEDARLRREMLEYGLSEVGQIVAELQIEEDSDGEGYDEDFFDDEDVDEEEDEDDEDKYGRTNHSVLNNDYRKRMEELQRKLGIKSSKEIDLAAAAGVDDDSGQDREGLGRIKVVGGDANITSDIVEPGEKGGKGKKSVKFATQLDIAPEDAHSTEGPKPRKPVTAAVQPLGDVLEHSRSSKPSTAAEKPERKLSRFKKDRAAGSTAAAPGLPRGPLDAPVRFLDGSRPTAPAGPDGQTVSETVLERSVAAAPADPDELDAALLRQEVSAEYHRLRNRAIQREGGFNRDDESPIKPPDEEDGGPRRMSRFKAARLSKQ